METIYGTSNADSWQLASATKYFARGGNDLIYGSNESDTLIGGLGSDNLSGGEGNDSLLGYSSYGVGKSPEIDTLSGGAGADTFWLTATNEGGHYRLYDRFGNRDLALIADYNSAEDKVALPGEKNDYVLGLGAEIVIGLDRNGSGFFEAGSDEAIAIVTGSSFTLDQAVFVAQTA